MPKEENKTNMRIIKQQSAHRRANVSLLLIPTFSFCIHSRPVAFHRIKWNVSAQTAAECKWMSDYLLHLIQRHWCNVTAIDVSFIHLDIILSFIVSLLLGVNRRGIFSICIQNALCGQMWWSQSCFDPIRSAQAFPTRNDFAGISK